MLYPYRASSVKNRQRWTFGSVYPRAWADWSGSDASMMQTECVIEGDDETRVTVRPCFLHLIERDVRELNEPAAAWTGVDELSSRPVASLEVGGRRFDAWQEAGEQHVEVPALTLDEFALWLNLKDVYFVREGRSSFDAIILFGSLLAISTWGAPLFSALAKGKTVNG